MPSPTRPRRRRVVAALLALALVAAACGDSDDDTEPSATTAAVETTPADAEADPPADGPASVALPEGAGFETVELGSVTVHAYLGITALNGNYVIESENAVVVVDTSFQDPDPATLRALADSIGKPIERVLITHAHPDHVGGLGTVFADVPVATTAGVAARIDAGDREIEVLDGPFTVDGVDYVATEYLDAEDESQMVVEVVDQSALFIGDLVYHDTHHFLTPELENWIAILEELQAHGAEVVFPGHGPVADAAALGETIDYLQTVIDLLPTVSTVEEYEAALFAAYPDLAGEFFTGLYADGLVAARGAAAG